MGTLSDVLAGQMVFYFADVVHTTIGVVMMDAHFIIKLLYRVVE